MANIVSREKQVRKSTLKRANNKRTRSSLKSAMKNFTIAYEDGNKEEALVNLNNSIRLLDRSVSKGVYTQNHVNRKKSRLQQAYNEMDA